MIGRTLEPLLAPIGFNWQIAIALVPGLAARENGVRPSHTQSASAMRRPPLIPVIGHRQP